MPDRYSSIFQVTQVQAMSRPPLKPVASMSERIVSIDALRGLTILVMIFVNDLASVPNTPGWMKHAADGADGMTFVDVVFPAFLFIMGMSIPFAIGRRLELGVSRWSVWRHVLIRTLGLLVIGVYMVNTEPIMERNDLATYLWVFLMYAAVMMVWNDTPRETGRARQAGLYARAAGIVILVLLALLYRGEGEPRFLEMQPYWWGILGLIGWAYLVACTAYIVFRNHPPALMGTMALLYCVFMAGQVDFFAAVPVIPRYLDIGSMLGSHAAITVSGVILGMVPRSGPAVRGHGARILWAVVYGLGLAAAGVMLHALHDVHKMFIISKNAATPPWCLISSALTVWIWAAVYWLMDAQGWTRWAAVLSPAGRNPLFAYVLAPAIYAALWLLGLGTFYNQTLGNPFALGLSRAVIFTFAVTGLAGYLCRRGFRLRL